jgi:hypothetical protein
MQSNLDQRVILYKSGTFSDITVKVNEWNNGKTADITMDPGDYLYIASFLPFNHKYLSFQTVSVAQLVPIIELCAGRTEWNTVADQLDYTDGFRESGILQFTPQYDEKGWGIIGKSTTEVDDLANAPVVYQSYWMRISFDDPAAFELKYIGQKFSSDVDLFEEYPNLRQTAILSGWATGKTDWDDQHLLAATYISKEMVQRGLIFTNNQILDISTLRNPAVHKTASIIYSGLGAKNYEAEIKLAAQNFETAMTQKIFQVDLNANAVKDRGEVLYATTSRATR